MKVLKFLLLVGSCTMAFGIWCKQECSKKVDVHCGDARAANCEYTGLNYCMVKVQECARMQRNFKHFNYIVRGKCFDRRPACREYQRIVKKVRKPRKFTRKPRKHG